jgi:hypothetical protein
MLFKFFNHGLALAVCAGLAWPAAAQTVNSFTVVNADTDQDIATFTNGTGSVSIANAPRINVRANVSSASRVVFSGNAGSRTEDQAPFALAGDKDGDYYAWSPKVGSYTITATPYSGTKAGPAKTLKLTVTADSGPPSTGPSVLSFTVVNADTGADIVTNASSASVSLASTPRISVRVNADKAKSVLIQEGSSSLIESVEPFSLLGDSNGKYEPWSPAAGSYTITATPYAGLSATGTAGKKANFNLSVTAGNPSPGGSGKLMVDPNNPRFFVYDRDSNGDGQRDVAYLAGSGGPEGFLYEDPDRQQDIVRRLSRSPSLNTPANGIYFHATRAFGGDGADFETPFVNNNPKSGIDANKLNRWRTVLEQLDNAGVILWFNLLDDNALPFGCNFNDDYRNYVTTIVNRFKDLKHIVWVMQEEYRFSKISCSASQSDNRAKNMAAAARAADPVHPIAVHHLNGQAMNFGDDKNIGVFGQQTGGKQNVNSPEEMHDKAGEQGWGDWVYVMAEAHPWHLELIDDELNNGSGRTPMRRSHWATAMSGGHVLMYNAFECKNAAKLCNEGPTDSDPTDAMLDDLRRLRLFMESIPFNRLAPLFNNALEQTRTDGTKYMLANKSAGLYVLYGDGSTGKLGARGLAPGSYALQWFDPAKGTTVNQTVNVDAGGLASFAKPSGFGTEVAVFVRKLS